jgi:hypothetical protein
MRGGHLFDRSNSGYPAEGAVATWCRLSAGSTRLRLAAIAGGDAGKWLVPQLGAST